MMGLRTLVLFAAVVSAAAMPAVVRRHAQGERSPTCPGSPRQMCRMMCSAKSCPAGQCVMHTDTCCGRKCMPSKGGPSNGHGCTDREYKDSWGTCKTYAQKGWCMNGKVGTEWEKSWGPLSAGAKSRCCACGGGVKHTTHTHSNHTVHTHSGHASAAGSAHVGAGTCKCGRSKDGIVHQKTGDGEKLCVVSNCPSGQVCWQKSMSSMISFGGRRLFGARAATYSCVKTLTSTEPCSRGKTEFDVGVFKKLLCPAGSTCSRKSTATRLPMQMPVRGRRLQMYRAPNVYCSATSGDSTESPTKPSATGVKCGGKPVPPGCTSFFDGCNNCGVSGGRCMCTKKMCFTTQPSKCLAYGRD